MPRFSDISPDKLPPTARQVVLFIVTGGVNTVFGYLVYAFFAAVLDWSYASALVMAYLLGISFSYMTFRRFVFKGGAGGLRSYMRFVPTYIALLAVNMAGLHLLVDRLGWGKLVSQALMAILCAALSFVVNKLFVFRERGEG